MHVETDHIGDVEQLTTSTRRPPPLSIDETTD